MEPLVVDENTPLNSPYSSRMSASPAEKATRRARLAALYIKAAQDDRSINHLTDPSSLALIEFYYSSFAKGVISLAFWILILLTFIENRQGWKEVAHIVEVLILSIFVFSWYKKTQFSLDLSYDWTHFVLLLALFVDALVSWSFAPNYFRYCRFLRPLLYLQYNRQMTHMLLNLCETVYRVKGVITLLLLHILLFSILGIALYHDTEEGTEHFGTLPDAFVNLIVLLSTCNSPDIYMPRYKRSHFSAIYFVSFIVVGIFLLLNLVLAVVYLDYRRQMKRETKRRLLFIRACTKLAFRTLRLRNIDHVTYRTVQELLGQMGFNQEQTQVYCELLDSSADRSRRIISAKDFKQILYVLNIKLAPPNANQPPSFGIALVRGIVQNTVYMGHNIGTLNMLDLLTDVLICLSGAMNLCCLLFALDDFMSGKLLLVLYIDAGTSLYFMLELSMKSCAVPRFIHKPWVKYDVLVSVLALVGSVYGLASGKPMAAPSFWPLLPSPHFLVLLRQIRMLRVVNRVSQLRFYIEVITGLIPAFSLFLGVVLILFYMYGILGMGLFKDVRIPAAEYTANDFSTFDSTLFTLFQLMIVNDWHRTMGAFVEATGHPSCRLYFITWYFCMVIVILNSITSFVVEAVEMQLQRTLKNRMEYASFAPSNESFESYARIPRRQSVLLQQKAYLSYGVEFDSMQQALTMDRLLNRVFDEEIDEPTDAEIEDYLDLIGLV